MTHLRKILSLLFGTFSALNMYSQIIFDLADNKTKTEYIELGTEPTIVFKNLVPNPDYTYSYEVEYTEKEIPGFDPSVTPEVFKDSSDETAAFEAALTAFHAVREEFKMTKAYKTLESEIEKLDSKKYSQEIQRGREALESSVYTKLLNFQLRNNQEITVTVTREGGKTTEGKDTTITWVRTFKTPGKSPWSVMYGFTFVPNLMNPVSNYHMVADTAANTFTITPLHGQRKDIFKNLSPTIMLTWTPVNRYGVRGSRGRFLYSNYFYQCGFTAGLSLNFASETGSVSAFVAPSIVIAKNVSLSTGVCMTQKQVLNGKYQDGQVLAEDLDFDQLHEKQFMGEWFISLAIRFEKNPFEKKEEEKK